MTSFTITHTDENLAVDTYSSNNIRSVIVDMSMPITPIVVPQAPDTDVILVKVEGNITTVTITWTVIDDGTTPFSGNNSAITAQAQVNHFKTSFVPVVVEDRYSLVLGTGSDAMTFAGTIQKMSFTVSGRSPVAWEGTLQFIHGDQMVDYKEDIPNPPIMSAPISNNSGTNGEVKLTGIQTEYLGSEAAITHYVVSFKPTSGNTWSTVEHATTNHNTQSSIVVDLNVTGSYDVKVAAKTVIDTGTFTTPVKVIIT
tara:strand:+ start:1043 stop:1807 length:765 start_codon:yes stop_codon:yes gene_type:complete